MHLTADNPSQFEVPINRVASAPCRSIQAPPNLSDVVAPDTPPVPQVSNAP
jgi:hypothetical protein